MGSVSELDAALTVHIQDNTGLRWERKVELVGRYGRHAAEMQHTDGRTISVEQVVKPASPFSQDIDGLVASSAQARGS